MGETFFRCFLKEFIGGALMYYKQLLHVFFILNFSTIPWFFGRERGRRYYFLFVRFYGILSSQVGPLLSLRIYWSDQYHSW